MATRYDLLLQKYMYALEGIQKMSDELIRAGTEGIDEDSIQSELKGMGEWGLGLIDILEKD
ncbi:hypothetical protein PMW_177 [Pseudomonas phage phiPMW]|uniref:Uncharacterized protein n=1 Tax=Pseudomonas phage phiPMW TaxID=1815582 RepID=A0A1S5R1J1_9CAUD|nr:hypothetical protein FDG97_gp173 [Pseudomonas phage phiPMW]ANA49302.1 hypothetical protein PMW_177 [Pseudomonas phage phiPMW]